MSSGITVVSGSSLTGYTWIERSPWISDPDVIYVRTMSGGVMHDNGRALPTCTVRGFAPRTAANESGLAACAGQTCTVSHLGTTWSARVVGISDAGSTQAHVFATLTLRRTSL